MASVQIFLKAAVHSNCLSDVLKGTASCHSGSGKVANSGAAVVWQLIGVNNLQLADFGQLEYISKRTPLTQRGNTTLNFV